MDTEKLKRALAEDRVQAETARNCMVKGCAKTRVRQMEAELARRANS